ncbi:MAG TPA: hypothetical protein V6D07_18995 [Trichocoleus sp.]
MANISYQNPGISLDYNLYDSVATPGLLYGNGMPVILPFTNVAKSQTAKWTIAVPATVDSNSTYKLTVNGQTVSVATTTTSQAQLTAALLSSLRSNPLLMRGLSITEAANLISVTALTRGIPVSVSSSSNATTTNDLTITEVSTLGTNFVVPFGRFVGRKFDHPRMAAGLIDSSSTSYATGQPGYLIQGVTVSTHAGERVGRGLQFKDGYQSEDVMNVFTARGNAQGIWVECTPENNLDVGDNGSPLYVATTAGFEGMLTKDNSAYAGRSLGTKVELMRKSVKVLNDRVIALVNFDRLSA